MKKIKLKLFLFTFFSFLFAFIFTIWLKHPYYQTKTISAETYNLYLWTILWHFSLFPFSILEPWDWIGAINKTSNFLDIFKLSFEKIISVFWNILFYFLAFCLTFKSEIKKFFNSKNIFGLKNYLDRFWKIIVLIIVFLVYVNILLIFLGWILFF